MRTVSLPNEELLPEVAKLLAEGQTVTLKTKGNSMLPFIVGGKDRVILQKKDIFTVGDIVLAEIAPKHFVLHRIIQIDGVQITLMGDGNLRGTEQCNTDNVCGHVIAIIKNGKHIKAGCGRIWKTLLPVRRYLLAIYRRIIL